MEERLGERTTDFCLSNTLRGIYIGKNIFEAEDVRSIIISLQLIGVMYPNHDPLTFTEAKIIDQLTGQMEPEYHRGFIQHLKTEHHKRFRSERRISEAVHTIDDFIDHMEDYRKGGRKGDPTKLETIKIPSHVTGPKGKTSTGTTQGKADKPPTQPSKNNNRTGHNNNRGKSGTTKQVNAIHTNSVICLRRTSESNI